MHLNIYPFKPRVGNCQFLNQPVVPQLFTSLWHWYQRPLKIELNQVSAASGFLYKIPLLYHSTGKQSGVGDCPTTRGHRKTTIVVSIYYSLRPHWAWWNCCHPESSTPKVCESLRARASVRLWCENRELLITRVPGRREPGVTLRTSPLSSSRLMYRLVGALNTRESPFKAVPVWFQRFRIAEFVGIW
jgi:hypothetical protein